MVGGKNGDGVWAVKDCRCHPSPSHPLTIRKEFTARAGHRIKLQTWRRCRNTKSLALHKYLE